MEKRYGGRGGEETWHADDVVLCHVIQGLSRAQVRTEFMYIV
jgi:hypothetical protein